MNTSQAEIDQILSRRTRRRTIMLPLRYGPLGELKRCPVKAGGVYRLRARVPYLEHVERAGLEPSRAHAVLALIDLCEQPGKSVVVTVTAVTRSPDEWVVWFQKGDSSSTADRPVFLGERCDYTLDRSRAARGEPEVLMPLAEDLQKAREKAREGRVNPQRQLVARMRADADMLAGALTNMKDRNRVRRIAYDLAKLDRELPSAGVVESSSRLARDEPHADAGSTHSQGALATPEAA